MYVLGRAQGSSRPVGDAQTVGAAGAGTGAPPPGPLLQGDRRHRPGLQGDAIRLVPRHRAHGGSGSPAASTTPIALSKAAAGGRAPTPEPRARDSRRDAARVEGRSLCADPHWLAGVVAYWSEGAKRSKDVRFANADPAMIKLFMAWASSFLAIPPDRFTITLHLHDGQDEDERKAFWSDVTGLPIAQFRKTFIKPEGTGHRKNVLYGGTATVRILRSGNLLHRIRGWIDAAEEFCLALR